MSPESLTALLRTLRRQILLTRAVRTLILGGFLAAIFAASFLPPAADTRTMFLVLLLAALLYVVTVISTVRLTREVHTGTMLLSAGRSDDAEVWLRRAVSRMAMSTHGKLIAAQQLAWMFFRRDAHPQVIEICQTLLRLPVGRLKSVWINTRLMLADSLLILDRVAEAYEAMRPVYDAPLSLADRMKLLPIQLRYELASDHSRSAVSDLSEKVKIAELLDAPRAALVHALLAEACQRESLAPQYDFLSARARLYCELGGLARRFPLIARIAATQQPAASPDAPGDAAADPAPDTSIQPEMPFGLPGAADEAPPPPSTTA